MYAGMCVDVLRDAVLLLLLLLLLGILSLPYCWQAIC
jgi:hypothetical protein